MKSYEATGKTYEEALESGLTALGATISDVDIHVIEEGSKGLFGLFGSRPYKVRLTLKAVEEDPLADLFAPAKPAKPTKKPEPKVETPVEKKPEPKAEKPVEAKAETTEAPKAEQPEQPKAEVTPKPVQRKAKQPKAEKPEGEKAEPSEKKERAPRAESASRKRKPKNENAPKAEKSAEERKAESTSRPLPPKEIKPIVKPVVTMIPDEEVVADSAAGKAQAFLKELTGLMGVDVTVAVGTDEENNIHVQMTGDTLGILIGRRGETLDAIQYLTSLKVNKGQDDYTRVTIDTENYRAKREDTLVRLANRMANRAVKTGRKVALEPMNPYERRVIHAALQANEAVDTHSEGEEPRRHVVITLRK